ncbi:MAG: malto-oligosyltrehalose trehalohydrolase [Planctomycetes bacterium GWF2_41_51]|nr:MAG: malto-oligosyltrehalose trehalohydrolase [Planctomycetes bacterium GWF2_41_51]HBG27074.1 malto-oligosyltrehalose trehalohydrolase [Phycisphaerales bacterium]
MRNFRVWSPKTGRMEIKINDKILPMTKKGEWWEYVFEFNEACDYGYIIDGKGPYPDPRSCYQPNGIHGLSRTIDHDSFTWLDQDWQQPPLAASILYELHIGTFTPEGTFEAAIEKLDYLKELGITHIEVMPVNEFAGRRGWGYDGVNIFAPHHLYGGPDGFKKFINSCHLKEMGVILDVVYNHFGLEGNYLQQFGPYFSKKYSTIWGNAFNFDGEWSFEPRQFIADNVLMWLRDYHLDGLRLDAVHSIYDQSAIHILEQIAKEVRKLEYETGRYFYLIAESDLNNPRIVQDFNIGGYGFDASWNDDFHHALHTVLTGETSGYYEDFGKIADLAKCLKSVFVYDGKYSKYRKAVHGRAAEHCDGSNFICYIQNHDQIGNRATGERISHLVSDEKAKIAAAIVLTSPFVPMIFQGEEFAASSPFQYFTDVKDEKLAQGITEGRKNEFGAFGWNPDDVPDPQSEQTFLNSKLNWSEIEIHPHNSMLDWYKCLIKLRKENLHLINGSPGQVTVNFDEPNKIIEINRGDFQVIVNLSIVQIEIKNKSEMMLNLETVHSH